MKITITLEPRGRKLEDQAVGAYEMLAQLADPDVWTQTMQHCWQCGPVRGKSESGKLTVTSKPGMSERRMPSNKKVKRS